MESRDEKGYRTSEMAEKPLPRALNGSIDVTPRGAYVAIVERNQRESPLLRLPPEIRVQIFQRAVGGKTIKLSFHVRNHGRKSNLNPLALLQVCRQLYAETAVLPFTSNEWDSQFFFDVRARPFPVPVPRDTSAHLSHLSTKTRLSTDRSLIAIPPPARKRSPRLRAFQWNSISTMVYRGIHISPWGVRKFATFPALKKVIIRLPDDPRISRAYAENKQDELRAGVNTGVDVVIEIVSV
ncbi:hypothetical protein P154DRAFT_280779 [Amniculicola lignicola CBS 123094]|uniref:Uncharacterized protein n=1 Tax=Amniculicola lignicola CBS 123094 TaxID=1392246 RepID=A0A6A5W6D4_9PLEO|nr:hypothetical protein P154DRAFT_280779 [Amniculicola lignicola CBS 123094]